MKQIIKIVKMPFVSNWLGTLVVTGLKVLYGLVPLLRVSLMATFIENVKCYLSGTGTFNSSFAILFFITILYEQSFRTIDAVASVQLKNSIWNKYNMQIIEKWSRAAYSSIENKDVYDLFMRVKDSVDKRIYDNYSSLISLVSVVINLTVLLAYISSLSAIAGSVLFLLFSLLVAVSLWGGKIQYSASVESKKAKVICDYYEDVLTEKSSIKERRVFGYAEKVKALWQQQFHRFVVARKSAERKYLLGYQSVAIGITVISIFMIYLFSTMVAQSKMTAGVFVALVTNIVTLIRSFSNSIDVNLRKLVDAIKYVKEYEFLMSLPEDTFVEDSVDFSVLELIDVRFKYPNSETYTLAGVNLKIEKGKSYALIGTNGAGKTTLIKILIGLYRNYEGKILVDGAELRENPKYYNLFTSLFQDFASFNCPLGDFVNMGRHSGVMTEKEILNMLKNYGLEYLTPRLPEGINTLLGKELENGVELSGGEWQKLALVRVACSDCSIKIYDEPTAALDPISESAIYETVLGKRKSGTLLLISHRLGLTKLVDEIFVLQDGTVVEQGTQDLLLGHNGVFSTMYNEQKRWYAVN